jgi:CRISPR-associated endonuclease/helicase Cas3
VCRSKAREWVTARLGLPDHDATGAWLAFWAGAHDIGKVSPGFQFQVRAKTGDLCTRLDAGFNRDYAGGSKPHGAVGTAVLVEELKRGEVCPRVDASDEAVARAVAIAVGGHHGLFPTDWNPMHGPLGNERWADVRRQMLAELARFCGITHRPAPHLPEGGDQSVWMFVAGLTSVADWIGSNQTFFESAGNPDVAEYGLDLGAYVEHAKRQAREALDKLGWLNRADSDGRRTFVELFGRILGGPPRPLQQAAEKIAGETDVPSLVLIEAPMGEGKTEAAWYLHHAWQRNGGQGAYVALPTMATSNQMFERVARFLEEEGGEGQKNLMLLHGKAALNQTFEKMLQHGKAAPNETFEIYDEDGEPSAVTAEAWFAANKKHGLLAPYGVGTIDQALLAVLQTKHVFVRLFGLAGKCVILDEVHAYDAYMTTLMGRLLRWLAALGCPVVLLSATLPRTKRLEQLRAYAGDSTPEPDDVPYPRITTVAVGGPPKACHVEADPKRARTVQLGWVGEDRLAGELRRSLAHGGCAAVIRNTVGLAQKTYLLLRDALKEDGIVVELFHARFPFGRRMEIEVGVLKRFGKDGGPTERDKRVLVATQVVEQSLDLDFDVMLTDVAPVDLVLQRAGRLHRHERGPRPAGVAEARVWLIEPPKKDGLPDFGDSEWIYARFVLLRSYLALKAVEALRLPDDLERLVEQVYGDGTLDEPDAWQEELVKTRAELEKEKKSKRRKAKGVLIYRPDDEDLLRQQNAQLDEDNPEAAEKIRAATRDTEPTVQVVLVYHIDGRDFLDSSGQEPFREREKPDLKRSRRLLDNEVTINHRGFVADYVGQPVPSGWRECGILRHHRVVRIDAAGKSLATKIPLHYDPDLGVTFPRGEGQETAR